jgi:uncharacterized protein (DUF1501 family)
MRSKTPGSGDGSSLRYVCETCAPVDRDWPRRAFLRVGGAGVFGLSLPNLFRLQAAEKNAPKKEISIIVLWLTGGLGQHDSFDPKPDAPADIRGEFRPIPTILDGFQICELMPEMAKQAKKYTVIRSMTHDQADHGVGQHLMLTGYRQTPAVEYPSLGSVIAHERGWRNDMPPYVIVPDIPPLPYFGPGVLGSQDSPFAAGDPNSSSYQVKNLNLPLDVDWSRMDYRKRMLAAVERRFRRIESDPNFVAMDEFAQRAYTLMSSPQARSAFDLSKEPESLREKYGYTATGQGALLARRLVEAGVRFVLVSKPFGTFDTHSSNFQTLRGELPELDAAAATLFEDLGQRGMLDSTIVLVTGEFGRSPKVNTSNAGRDHWPKVFSLVVGGGGFQRGFVYGTSDAKGDEVKDKPVTPEAFAATLYEQVGVDYRKVIETPIGRPIRIVNEADPLRAVLT